MKAVTIIDIEEKFWDFNKHLSSCQFAVVSVTYQYRAFELLDQRIRHKYILESLLEII